MKEIKEIFEALGTRLKSPLFGYSFLAFIAANWKPIFYLFVSSENPAVRIAFFEKNTSNFTLFAVPICFAICMAIFYPWISLLFLFLARFPTDYKNHLQVISEHKLLLKRQQMEELRARGLSSREKELIERAKRDQEIRSIEDAKIRQDLQQELNQLRKQNNSLSHSTNSDDERVAKLTSLIDTYRTLADESQKYNNRQKAYKYGALVLETQEKLAELLASQAQEKKVSPPNS